jgi:hypothetical protein
LGILLSTKKHEHQYFTVKKIIPLGIVLLFLTMAGACSFNKSNSDSRVLASQEEAMVDCQLLDKGCLLKRDSGRLIIFFRGWVSPSMANRYGGSRKEVAQRDCAKAAEDLLFEDLQMANIPLESSLFVVGSAHLGLSQEELILLMEESGAQEVIFASHSGGYKGMRQTILPMPLEFWRVVSGIWLLDNYYGGAGFANDLERNFGFDFLASSCFGFVTDHNHQRFESSYKRFCPQTLTHGVGHSQGVNVCLPFFERGEECRP